MSGWLIRIQNGAAYIWKRKFFFGMIAIPWALHGGTRIIRTPLENLDVVEAATDYILEQDPHATILITYKPWT